MVITGDRLFPVTERQVDIFTVKIPVAGSYDPLSRRLTHTGIPERIATGERDADIGSCIVYVDTPPASSQVALIAVLSDALRDGRLSGISGVPPPPPQPANCVVTPHHTRAIIRLAPPFRKPLLD
jgi:hypothetical protein